MVCRAVHAGLDGWQVDEREGGWCPVFTLSYVELKLSVLGAVSEIDVDFAAVGCAVDKEVGGSGWENWWSGRAAAWRAVMCKGAWRVTHFVDSG
jgi:hypothetical protein